MRQTRWRMLTRLGGVVQASLRRQLAMQAHQRRVFTLWLNGCQTSRPMRELLMFADRLRDSAQRQHIGGLRSHWVAGLHRATVYLPSK